MIPWLLAALSLCTPGTGLPPRHMDSVIRMVEALESPHANVTVTIADLALALGGCSTPGCRAVLGEPPHIPTAPPALNPDQWQLLTRLLHRDGAVLAPDGSTVALGPLLAGIAVGLRRAGEGPILNASVDPLFAVTIAEALGTSFLTARGGDGATLGPGGCWDDVDDPQNYTLLGPPSLVPDAVANGAMDGVLLGNRLAGDPIRLAKLLRDYYGTGNGTKEGRAPSSYRRRDFGVLAGPGKLEEEVLAMLRVLRVLPATRELLEDVGAEEEVAIARRAARDFTERYVGGQPPVPTHGVPNASVDPLFAVTIAEALGTSFLTARGGDGATLGPGGCWDDVDDPQNYTLLGPLSLVPDAVANGAMDGVLLGNRLAGDPIRLAKLLQCPAIVPRCMWGARPYRGTPKPLSLPLGSVYIHHTFSPGAPCRSFASCARAMRAMQRFHQDTRGWDDIGYSFVVGSDGYVYQGRGWHWVGAHTKGYNSRGYGVGYVGDFSATPPDADTIALVRDELLPCAVRAGRLRHNYTVRGHRQMGHTDCPGESLFREIETWRGFV